ncbi:MAG: 2-hydroxyacyl-CoA dehydratase subunit D [Candidatus Omnitrophota bacterium]
MEINISNLETVEEIKHIFMERRQELLNFADQGGVIFTYSCLLPKLIVHACGGQVVKLLGIMNLFGCNNHIIDEYFSHGSEEFCTLIRDTFGLELKAPYPRNMQIVDVTTCAALTKLISMMYMEMPEFGIPHIANIPRRGGREIEDKFWLRELVKLKEFCEEKTGQKATDEKLRESIRDENKKKDLIKELDLVRKGDVIPIMGSECMMVIQQQNWLRFDRYIKQLENIVEEAKERKRKGITDYEPGAPRVLVADPCFFEPFRGEIEPYRCVKFLESCGAAVVAEDFCCGVGEHWSDIEEKENDPDPLKTIADFYLNVLVPCPFPTPNSRRLTKCIEAIKRLDIEGVIYMTTHACKVAAAEARKFERAIEKETGIPTLHIERYGDPDKELAGQLKMRVDSFVTMLKDRRNSR